MRACRTEAAELRAATFQAEAASAQDAQKRAVAEQHVQEAARETAEEQLQDARMLVAWQERRIADLQQGDANQTVRGYAMHTCVALSVTTFFSCARSFFKPQRCLAGSVLSWLQSKRPLLQPKQPSVVQTRGCSGSLGKSCSSVAIQSQQVWRTVPTKALTLPSWRTSMWRTSAALITNSSQ